MSHQSGIQGNASLLKFFSEARNPSSNIRLIKVVIENEEMTLKDHAKVHKSWEEDYDKLVTPCLVRGEPCYIFYRLDSKNASGYEWLFISFTPDDAPVRHKMLYASTRATLKKEFGGMHIKEELSGTAPADVNLSGYKRHKRAETGPAPLTAAEEELEQIKKAQTGVDIGVDTKHQTLQGVAFPISPDARTAFQELKQGRVNYVLMSLDTVKETINLETARNVGLNDLSRLIPKDHGRYTLVRFPHNYEGDHFDSLVFIYTMPASGCSIKERMLYSSCKNQLIDTVETAINMPVSKRVETDDPTEINEAYLLDQLHPQIQLHQLKFQKPKGPTSRGNKRITKDAS
ncbi:twinfilin-2-like [Paramacrobiotus metropolitanus]|uniref:twinfilin-2-like n=1 Tax=Paramacrobiotus metropolitanus TaxID=2943436 RepID=UPI0024461CF4|nr:twinfilin-2-like [Paramacrobiotus metropolitanus]